MPRTRPIPNGPKGKSPTSADRPELPAAGGSRGWRWEWLGATAALVAAGLTIAVLQGRREPAAPAPMPASAKNAEALQAPAATFVGGAACRKCHEAEFAAWTGSHHDLAMQEASDATVLGDFRECSFEAFGVTTTFFRRDGKHMVRTDGPDGRPTEYPIAYTFGVEPLQQYLVPMPGGRYQALPIAWDSRPKSAGGGRWFHLYPTEHIAHNDQLHWTGRYQNWNLMCAECHSTNLQKGYEAATDSYKTLFSEIDVSCEACHGPGSRHVAWARAAKRPYTDADRGLVTKFASGWATDWKFDASERRWPSRGGVPAAAMAAANACAPCHARRSTIAEGVTPGEALSQSHRLSLPTPPLYHADGQQRDEVYEWGSFLQSRMHAKGVTCMDCHEPHALKVRSEGNALCARCHTPELFDTPKHHFHASGSAGANCTACHMPSQKYMVVHDRLDHSLRVPRPDLSEATGSPNACTMCHTDKDAAWAAKAMDGWYPPAWRKRPEWGTALAAGATQGAHATAALARLAQDGASPAIIRATAGSALSQRMRPELLAVAAPMLNDPEPAVRISGLGMLEGFDASIRVRLAAGLLDDGVRGVRIEAANLLADVGDAALSAAQRQARAKANGEYEAALRLNADWPAENVAAGNFALRRGMVDDAIAAYRRAIRMDARFIGAYVNLADALRQAGRDAEGERVLREALASLPESADVHHSLGLLLVRLGRRDEALAMLEAATRLEAGSARYAYVYGVALHSAGNVAGALDVLRKADARHPFEPEVLSALVSMLAERNGPGDRDEAVTYARKLAEAMPNDAGVRGMIEQLSAPPGGGR